MNTQVNTLKLNNQRMTKNEPTTFPNERALIEELQRLAPAKEGSKQKAGSVQAAADFFGVNRRTWGYYKSGHSSPTLTDLRRWAAMVGVGEIRVLTKNK